MIDYNTELRLHNEELRRAYKFTSSDRILDIGCGTGQTTREIARLAPNGTAVGVDIDEAMVRRARELAATEGISNIRFEVADVERQPFRKANSMRSSVASGRCSSPPRERRSAISPMRFGPAASW